MPGRKHDLINDIYEDGLVLLARLSQPKGVSKATVQRRIAALSENWTPEQHDAGLEIFQTHGLL